jgi:GNAT superfamily N-acetyltransferase
MADDTHNNLMPLNIRPALASDASAIGAILANIDDYPQWKDVGATALTKTATQALLTIQPDRTVYVAQLDSKIIGYAAVYWLQPLFSDREGYVSELFIQTDASGQGAGTELLNAIQSEAKLQGCSRLTLINLKDRESYRRGFYASRGWEERANATRFTINL